MRIIGILFVISAAAVAMIDACSPYSPALGDSPFLCGTDPLSDAGLGVCPEGYTCKLTGTGSAAARVCVAPMGTVPIDSNTSGCADDSMLEPNNTYQTAYMTPVDVTKATLTFSGLAICPAGDVDHYAITISGANKYLSVKVIYDEGGAILQAAILGSTGTALASAAPVTGQINTIRAYLATPPVGQYYAQVKGPTSGMPVTNNYKLIINVCTTSTDPLCM